MTMLHQLIALEKQVKTTTDGNVNAVYHQLQKPLLYNGQIRTYAPMKDGDTQLPGVTEVVQATFAQNLTDLQAAMERQIDLIASKDRTNQDARADIILHGRVIASDIPVSTLLWLEKRLVDIRTILATAPTLDPTEVWTYDSDAGFYRSAPVQSMRTTKVLRNHVKAPATDKHPAQVDVFSEDTPQGIWTTVKTSGALPASRKAQLIAQANEMLEAVKVARTAANTTPIVEKNFANGLLNSLFR